MMDLDLVVRTFSVSSCAGAIGGFVGGINTAEGNRVRWIGRPARRPGNGDGPRPIDLGFLGDILVGAAAGIAIVFFLNIGGTTQTSVDAEYYLRLIPLALMAGVVSKRALAGMSEAVIGKLVSDTERLREGQARLQNQLTKLDYINDLVQEGEGYLKEGEAERSHPAKRIAKYESARDTFLKAIEVDRGHSVAYICLGKALKRLAAETTEEKGYSRLIREAIEATSEAIKLNPTYDRAYYNRACYKALAGVAASEILPDLEKAIELFEPNRAFAQSDGDFQSIHKDPCFAALVLGNAARKTAENVAVGARETAA